MKTITKDSRTTDDIIGSRYYVDYTIPPGISFEIYISLQQNFQQMTIGGMQFLVIIPLQVFNSLKQF